MIRRLIAAALLGWLLGFGWFAMALPRPLADGRTEAIVVLTGGEGRIQRGLAALEQGLAGRLLVSGVDRNVRPVEFAVEYKVPATLMVCCVTLGFEATDTRSNARETARWIAVNKVRSVRLVTSDWHMRRAAYELERMQPPGLVVLRDAVPSRPSLRMLVLEYNKWLARRLAALWGS